MFTDTTPAAGRSPTKSSEGTTPHPSAMGAGFPPPSKRIPTHRRFYPSRLPNSANDVNYVGVPAFRLGF